jgi:hypothetical protein
MNTHTGASSGSAVEPHGRITSAIPDSMIASVAGYAASVFAMCTGDLCFFGLNHASTIPAQQAIGNVIGIVVLEAMWNAFGSLAGALVGAILTGVESWPFSGWPFQLLSWIFVPFGVIDAVVATATLIHLRRKSSRLINEGN